MTPLESFSPRIPLVFVDGSASETLASVSVGSRLGAGKVTRITDMDRVIIVERDGLPNVRIYSEGYGVERAVPVTQGNIRTASMDEQAQLGAQKQVAGLSQAVNVSAQQQAAQGQQRGGKKR